MERAIYRLVGVQPDDQQRWTRYLSSLLAFSVVSVLVLYALLLLQVNVPEPWGHKGMTPALAFNTAISFTTNTSWQNYPGESTLGHIGLVAGLGVQAFASCAVGMCVAVALIRGLIATQNGELGNFWVDLVRTVVRILLPLSIVVTRVMLLALGVVANFDGAQEISTLAGGTQTILGGPVAAWESIKLMSGDGGGAFNVNSAHPFENPTPASSLIEIVAMLLIPVAFVRTFGVMVGNKKQGWALFAAVAILFVIGAVAIMWAQMAGHGTVVDAVGAPTEGTETRFGVPGSALFGQAATASGDGAANASYDSFASLGGGVLLMNMMLGEVAPGGAGSGLYGLVVMALLAVFLGGLMVGTTPEFLKKRLHARHMKLVESLHLGPAGDDPGGVRGRDGAARAAGVDAQRGAARAVRGALRVHEFGGQQRQRVRRVQRQHDLVQRRVGVGDGRRARFIPIIAVLALAGTFADQRPGVVTAGTLRTHQPTFIVLIVGVTLIMVGLEYLPALALGPVADALG